MTSSAALVLNVKLLYITSLKIHFSLYSRELLRDSIYVPRSTVFFLANRYMESKSHKHCASEFSHTLLFIPVLQSWE